MRVEASTLFCSYHAPIPSSPGERAPLVVVQVTQYRLNELFTSTIIDFDPRRCFAADEAGRELLGRVQHLRGAQYPNFESACRAFFEAYEPSARGEIRCTETFLCYVVPLEDLDPTELACYACDVKLRSGGKFTSILSPGLVDLPVRVLQDEPRGEPQDRRGQWMAVGHGRPYVPVDMEKRDLDEEMAKLWKRVPRAAAAARCHTRAHLTPPAHGRAPSASVSRPCTCRAIVEVRSR